MRPVRGSAHGKAKLTEDDVRVIRAMLAAGETQVVIGSLFGVSHRAVGNIRNGKTWTYVL